MEKFTQLSLEQYLHELSSDRPVPGGGSVSAYVASLAMGLSQMVIRIALKRKKKAGASLEEEARETQRRSTLENVLESLEKAKRDAFQIVNLDPEIYEQVMSAWGGDETKMEDALHNSFRLQADLAFLIVMAAEWNVSLDELISGSIKNDLLVSAGLLKGAFHGAYHTAMINVKYMKNTARKEKCEKALEELKVRFQKGKVHAGEPS
ncbi:MAG TPA: cyclodeaminase/cyclohydrolase family protein [Verrucomicrobiae bacterium]|jgi:formiminotetrahydrofolate cyclodeaminase|nr:cyclodeaminase/cyclohydrolase family protein [Verrucomicrobiae bacterium]